MPGIENPGRRPKATKGCELPLLEQNAPPAGVPACITASQQEDEPIVPHRRGPSDFPLFVPNIRYSRKDDNYSSYQISSY